MLAAVGASTTAREGIKHLHYLSSFSAITPRRRRVLTVLDRTPGNRRASESGRGPLARKARTVSVRCPAPELFTKCPRARKGKRWQCSTVNVFNSNRYALSHRSKRVYGGKRDFSCLVLKTDKPDFKQFG